MTNIKEQTIPTAYSREVNVESTLKYMGEVITFLVLGNALILTGLATFCGRLLSRNLTDNSCERNELHIESGGLFCDSLQSLVLVFGFVKLSPSVYVVMTKL